MTMLDHAAASTLLLCAFISVWAVRRLFDLMRRGAETDRRLWEALAQLEKQARSPIQTAEEAFLRKPPWKPVVVNGVPYRVTCYMLGGDRVTLTLGRGLELELPKPVPPLTDADLDAAMLALIEVAPPVQAPATTRLP